MADLATYSGREQTLVKHFILRKYLERFAYIIGSHWDAITYVDCFAGPWNVRSDKLEDSSFHIAIEELRKARESYRQRGREIRIRCFFIERDTDAFPLLKKFADGIEDVEIETRNSEFEDAIDAIVRFVRAGGTNSFPFIFIDPTGWTGFGMKVIAPLLRLNPGEVLINLMTGHISRFVESPQEQAQHSFEDLFGSSAFKSKIEGLARTERLDALVEAYADNVRHTGKFRYACSAAILHPEIDRVHFHLVYATRSPRGVEVFKETEKRAMAVMEEARAEAQQRKREARSRQTEMFGSRAMHRSGYYDALRDRYLAKAQTRGLEMLRGRRSVTYDELWEATLSVPLVWESDLKDWLREWKDSVRIEGMEPRQRSPRRGAENRVVWLRD